MLVVVMENHVLPPASVCQNCLMADHSGQPRWQAGKLQCGQMLEPRIPKAPVQYRCAMGFRIAEVGV